MNATLFLFESILVKFLKEINMLIMINIFADVYGLL